MRYATRLERLTFLNFAERDRLCISINFKREDIITARESAVSTTCKNFDGILITRPTVRQCRRD